MHGLWHDLRYSVRVLLKSPGFTAVAVLSLALGIGANTAIFQLLDVLRLKSLPVSKPEQLAEVRIVDMEGARGSFDSQYPTVTNPIWEQIRDEQQVFSGISAWGAARFNLAEGGEVRPARGLYVSGDFFRVLGVPPVLGRVFTASDDVRGCGTPGVIISNAFWQREYGGDKNVIGRKLTLSRHPFEIIGVTPATFFGLEVGRSFDVALPICAEAIVSGPHSRLQSGTDWWLFITGRLKPGISLEQATASLQAVSPSLFQRTLPANYPPVSVQNYLDFKLEASEGGAGHSALRENYERPLWLLLAIAAMVLLIACANLANLLLARASLREREMAVRQAVGASRFRLIRQLLAESLLLVIVGATLGVFLAQGLSKSLVSFLSTAGDSLFLDLALDWHVLGFTAVVGAVTCILFGLTPAIRAARIAPSAAMKTSGRGLTTGGRQFTLRRALVVAQVAISLVLVATAVLFSRSLAKLTTVEAGFRQEGVLIARASFASLNLPPERRLAFRQEMLNRIKFIPGVEAVTDANIVPLSGSSSGNSIWLDGNPERKMTTAFSRVGRDYFSTLRTPFLGGRDFDERDASAAQKVAIVNEAFARKLVNGSNPVGSRFWIEATPGTPERQYEIVGLVKDTKYEHLREEFGPIAFLASVQDPRPAPSGQFLIRSRLKQDEITAAVTRALGEFNPAVSVQFQGFKSMIDESVLRERLMATLSGFFGGLALLLASIGLYGILSYGVASRTNELGIRMALGAQTRHVLSLVLREAVILVLIGVAVGLPFVFWATRFASTLLFELKPGDPVSVLLAALLILVVALIAAYLPARRATRVDPLAALRYE
jgi:putative ABC transport system permease protein